MATWGDQTCQRFEATADGFETGFSRLRVRHSDVDVDVASGVNLASVVDVTSGVDISNGVDVDNVVDVASGVDVARGVYVASSVDVVSDVDVASGVDIDNYVDVASCVDVASGVDVGNVVNVASGIHVAGDVWSFLHFRFSFSEWSVRTAWLLYIFFLLSYSWKTTVKKSRDIILSTLDSVSTFKIPVFSMSHLAYIICLRMINFYESNTAIS